MNLRNPFVANPLGIIEKVTRKIYERDKNKYKEYTLDFERDADHNEHYTLLVHKERHEGLLIIEKEKLYRIKE
jgi:hypothetical protein